MSIQNPNPEEVVGGADVNTPAKLSQLEAAADPSFREVLRLNTSDIEKMLSSNADTLPVEGTPDEPAPDDTATPEGGEGVDDELLASLAQAMATEDANKPAEDKKVPLSALKSEREARQEKEKLAEENNEKRIEAERRAAYWQAVAEQGVARTPSAPAAPTVDPVQEIESAMAAAARAKEEAIIALKEEYDRGKMLSVDEYKRSKEIEAEYMKKVVPLAQQREQILTQRQQPPADQVHERIISDPWLTSQTKTLMEKNPWVEQASDSLFEALKAQATARIEAQTGRPLASDVMGTWELRKEIVKVGEEWGLGKAVLTTAPAASPTNQDPNKPTAEQRLAKLELANNHPPSLNKAGAALPYESTGAEGMTDPKKIAKDLGAEQIGKLLGAGS